MALDPLQVCGGVFYFKITISAIIFPAFFFQTLGETCTYVYVIRLSVLKLVKILKRAH